MTTPTPEPKDGFTDQIADLRHQVAHLQEALTAIGSGGVDAVVVGEPEHELIYTLVSADRPYRVIVESMGEGAVTVTERGVILFANPQFAAYLGVERDSMVGHDLHEYVAEEHVARLTALLESTEPGTRRAELQLAAGPEAVPFLVASTDLDLEGTLVRCLVFTDLTMQKEMERQKAIDAAHAARQRMAQEVNDTIVQGLVAAEMALDLDQHDLARSLVGRTSEHARDWIGTLAGQDELKPGMAVRQAAAHAFEDES
jgi:PAS domain S-box-containing protein